MYMYNIQIVNSVVSCFLNVPTLSAEVVND